MEELESRFDSMLNKIPDSKFIVIDCEFSGINPKPSSIRTLNEYLLALKDDVEEYALLQIGFCLATDSDNPEDGRWTLHPYNFYTYSSEMYNTIFLNDTMKWLRDNGFSFDRWVDEGLERSLSARRVDFKRLGDLQSDSGSFATKRKRKNELQNVVKAIIEYRIPLVFHNGILDVLHLYDKFIGPLPEKPVEISKEISRYPLKPPTSRIFVGGVFDTKLVGKYLCEKLNIALLKSTTLPMLHTNLNSIYDLNSIVVLARDRDHLGYLDRVFAAELYILARSDDLKPDDLIDFRDDERNRGSHIHKLINCCNIHDPIEQPIYKFNEHAYYGL